MTRLPKQGRTEEEVEDIVGAMADAGYGLEYDDAAGLIAATRRGPNPYDAAQTFEESSLNLVRNQTAVSDESIELGDAPSSFGTTADVPDLSENTSYSNERGLMIRPGTELEGVQATLGPGCDADVARLIEHDSGDELTTVELSGAGEVDLLTPISSGTEYRLVLDNLNTEDISIPYEPNASYPIESNDIDVTAGVGGSSTFDNYLFAFDSVTAVETVEPASSGYVHVMWPSPTDLYEWDLATFTATENGEIVDVYAAYDDGSGWTRANGGDPITRNYSLRDDPDISPSDGVRIEAELSRDDTSNNPTLDSAYRSWVV